MDKLITYREAANLVKDGDLLATLTFGLGGLPEQLLVGVEERYAEEQHPKDITFMWSCGIGNSQYGRGADHMIAPGLVGLSLGGGSELALACQAIIATEKGSMGFPESGLGIYPGLGGMLRTNHQIGKELAKYFVMSGRGISAKDAHDLGIVTKLVDSAHINEGIEELIKEGRPDKYRQRAVPAKFEEVKVAFSDDNFNNTINGLPSEGVSPEFAAKMGKTISYKAPSISKQIPEMINQQANMNLDEGIAYELGLLNQTFGKKEALIGLEASLAGQRPDYSKLA